MTRTKGRKDVEWYVARIINSLQNGVLSKNSTYTKALLAQLRRGLTAKPGDVPDTWELEFGRIPEPLRGEGDAPATAGEWAIHLALALYAVHQQSQQSAMYRRTDVGARELYGFGTSVRKLADKNRTTGQGEQLTPDEMPRRFKAMVTSESIEELAHYARQIVTQLRGAGIPLDYGTFAGQIYDYQSPYQRDNVRLEWAREFSVMNEDNQKKQDAGTPTVD